MFHFFNNLRDKHTEEEIYNEEGKLLTVGMVKLYFMDEKLGNRAAMPPLMLEKLSVYFS